MGKKNKSKIYKDTELNLASEDDIVMGWVYQTGDEDMSNEMGEEVLAVEEAEEVLDAAPVEAIVFAEEPVAAVDPIIVNPLNTVEPSTTGIKFDRMLSEKPTKFRKYFTGKGVRY